MDRFTREFIKMMQRNNSHKGAIVVLVLILLILATPVVFILGGGLDKIKEFREDKSSLDVDSEKIVSKIDEGVDSIVGTEAEAELTGRETRIEDLIAIGELQTLEYRYNAICRACVNDEPVYYIAYEATVQLGINFEDVTVDYGSEDDKVITVMLPEVEILSSTVDAGSLDYIFVDEYYNEADAAIHAQSLCEEDLYNKVQNDENMYASARENTEAEITALTEPLVEQFYPDYQLVVVWKS